MAKKIDRYAQFEVLAKERNYDSPKKMLTYLYNERRQSKYEIRAQLKCSWGALKWAFKEYGIKTRQGGANRRDDVDDEEVKRFCKTHTQPEAVAHFGCSQMLISRVCRGIRNSREIRNHKAPVKRVHESISRVKNPPIKVEFDVEGFLAASCKRNACKFCSGELQDKDNPTCENCRWRDMYNEATLDRSYPITCCGAVYSAPEKMYTLRGRS